MSSAAAAWAWTGSRASSASGKAWRSEFVRKRPRPRRQLGPSSNARTGLNRKIKEALAQGAEVPSSCSRSARSALRRGSSPLSAVPTKKRALSASFPFFPLAPKIGKRPDRPDRRLFFCWDWGAAPVTLHSTGSAHPNYRQTLHRALDDVSRRVLAALRFRRTGVPRFGATEASEELAERPA